MVYYIGRTNLSIAKPLLMSEYGISATIMGFVGTTFFLAYALGQFVNGFLGDKIGARRFITIGLIVSSIIGAFSTLNYFFLPGILSFMGIFIALVSIFVIFKVEDWDKPHLLGWLIAQGFWCYFGVKPKRH